MKSFYTLAVLLLLSVLFPSCKKDIQKTLSDSLVGKWSLDSTYIATNVSGKDTVVGLPLQYREIIEYKSDLTYRDSFSIGTAAMGTVVTGNWTLTDSSLLLATQSSQRFTIMQLDDVQLKTVYWAGAGTSIFYWYTRK